MRKTFIRPLIFLLTLGIGLGIYYARYFPAYNSTSDNSLVAVNNSVQSEQIRTGDEYITTESYNLAPCESVNSLKKYKFPRKKNTVAIGVVNGWIRCGVLPEYPQNAQERKVSGKVVLDVLIDETGEIAKASIRSGNSLFRQAALKAAHQSRSCPILLGGESMKGQGILIYQFDSERGVSLPKNFPIKSSAH